MVTFFYVTTKDFRTARRDGIDDFMLGGRQTVRTAVGITIQAKHISHFPLGFLCRPPVADGHDLRVDRRSTEKIQGTGGGTQCFPGQLQVTTGGQDTFVTHQNLDLA